MCGINPFFKKDKKIFICTYWLWICLPCMCIVHLVLLDSSTTGYISRVLTKKPVFFKCCMVLKSHTPGSDAVLSENCV